MTLSKKKILKKNSLQIFYCCRYVISTLCLPCGVRFGLGLALRTEALLVNCFLKGMQVVYLENTKHGKGELLRDLLQKHSFISPKNAGMETWFIFISIYRWLHISMRCSDGRVKHIQVVSLEISVPLSNHFPISNLYCMGCRGHVSPFVYSIPQKLIHRMEMKARYQRH